MNSKVIFGNKYVYPYPYTYAITNDDKRSHEFEGEWGGVYGSIWMEEREE